MKTAWWFRGLLSLGRIARVLSRIADAQERLANAAEGLSPPGREVLPFEEGPPQIARTGHHDFAFQEQVEQGLTKLLGRPPTEDELWHELEGVEWGVGDIPAAKRERLGL